MLFIMATILLPQNVNAEYYITTQVTSFGTYDFRDKHFCILSNMENISSDDVEFKEYAKYISYAFQMKGGVEVSPESDKADICILLSYDIKDASYIRTVSEPVWGKTSVSSVTAHTNSSGTHYDYHYNRGIVGYKQSDKKVDLFIRYIDLFVYELSHNKDVADKMIWKAYVKSEGSGDNLFEVFPTMVCTLSKYIGKTIAKNYDKGLGTNDLIVKLFEQGILHLKSTTWLETKPTNAPRKWNTLIYYIEKTSTQTIVHALWAEKVFKNTYIEVNGQKYPCTAISNPKSGGVIPISEKSNNVLFKINLRYYLDLYFPPLPEDAIIIDVVSQKKKDILSKKDYKWEGIRLRNW